MRRMSNELKDKVEKTKNDILNLIENLKEKIIKIEHSDSVPVYFVLYTDIQPFLELSIKKSNELIQKVNNLEG